MHTCLPTFTFPTEPLGDKTGLGGTGGLAPDLLTPLSFSGLVLGVCCEASWSNQNITYNEHIHKPLQQKLWGMDTRLEKTSLGPGKRGIHAIFFFFLQENIGCGWGASNEYPQPEEIRKIVLFGLKRHLIWWYKHFCLNSLPLFWKRVYCKWKECAPVWKWIMVCRKANRK